jgi:hypothetical protein
MYFGKRNLAGMALSLLAAVVTGCGGGGHEADEAARMGKPAFVKRLGDTCQEHSERQVVAREAWQKKHGFPPQDHAGRGQLEQELVVVILPIVRDTIREVGKIRPPQSEEKKLKAFIDALQRGVAVSEEDPSWVATAAEEPFMKARELSLALGTPLCGQA